MSMRRINKILLLIILFLLIVCTSMIAYTVWITPISKADSAKLKVSKDYISNETQSTNTKEEDVLVVDLEEKKEETTENKSEEKATENDKNNTVTETVVKEMPTFKDVNETVYASSDVNIREEPNSSSNRVGVLKQNESVNRTGIGSNGWDRVIYNNTTRYIYHSYLSTQKVQVTQPKTDTSKTTQNTTQKSSSNTTVKTSNFQYPDGWINNFNSQIAQLKSEYPSGYYWNHAGGVANGSVTKTPCNHNANQNYCNTYQGKSTQACGFSIGRQCAGFTSMLSDRIFGKDAPTRIFYNYDDIRVGDQARINNNSHKVFILEKTDDYVIVAECNADYKTCVINWGRKIYRNNLKGFYITRWQ